jgi:hypothetical protein
MGWSDPSDHSINEKGHVIDNEAVWDPLHCEAYSGSPIALVTQGPLFNQEVTNVEFHQFSDRVDASSGGQNLHSVGAHLDHFAIDENLQGPRNIGVNANHEPWVIRVGLEEPAIGEAGDHKVTNFEVLTFLNPYRSFESHVSSSSWVISLRPPAK